jgi:hypothetical protein
MAELDLPILTFDPDGCPDCGLRAVHLPAPLPQVGDDFDWQTRDFDGFRLHMLEDLAARLPERGRFTPADLEVVLIEALAGVLDQLSDMADRVFAEGYLETARDPRQVLALLRGIGFDPTLEQPSAGGDAEARLLAEWTANPLLMELHRREGPRRIAEQQRMVTLEDFERELARHPLVERCRASRAWSGSYWLIRAAVSLFGDLAIDVPLPGNRELEEQIAAFHRARALPMPGAGSTPRVVLEPYLAAYRMLGQPVELVGAVPAGLDVELCLRIDRDYFHTEMRQAALAALGRGPGQFFEPGRLRFGEPIYASDLIQALAALEGVEDVEVERFKRVGSRFTDQVSRGVITLSGLEVARCDNDPKHPELGTLRLRLSGGRNG